jgi:probable HAF family extracellular repeat protein
MNTLRKLRNYLLPWVTTLVLACFSTAVAQDGHKVQGSYRIIDLGNLPNDNLGCAMALNNRGWTIEMNGLMDPASNFSGAKVLSGHAAINIDGFKIDLGTLGGPNSWMNWGGINDRGEAVGMAETDVPDPDGEDICTFGTKLTCKPFLWRVGHMSALPTLGGNNGQASDINNHSEIAGTAETAATDPTCPPNHVSLPVLWEDGKPHALPTVGLDPDGFAFAINEHGQAVGYSGTCTSALHAVSWVKGTAFVLPDLGQGAIGQGVNDHGQIAGIIGSADGSSEFGALWQNGVLTNLGTLPGDFAAIATGINSRGQIVGSTLDAGFNWSHGFIWQDGVMTDINTLLPADSNLFVTMANKINDHGQISGMATVLSGPHAGDIHAFLATPVDGSIGRSIADLVPGRPKANVATNLPSPFMLGFTLKQFPAQ